MYVCMYVCMNECMYVCMHACMHACMYVFLGGDWSSVAMRVLQICGMCTSRLEIPKAVSRSTVDRKKN